MTNTSRISNCLLSNGRSATRVSPVEETDAEVLTALHNCFGNGAVSAQIQNRTYHFNQGLENLLEAIYKAQEVEVMQ